MANAPERWARNFMNDAESGNKIPIRHTNNSGLTTLNIALPNLPSVGSVMPQLRPIGTRSGLGMLPNLKKPLVNTRRTLHASSPAWVPPTLAVPPAPFGVPPPLPTGPPPPLNPEYLINFMLNGRRLYIDNFHPEQLEELAAIMGKYRNQYNIRYWNKDNRTGKQARYPFYYITSKVGSKKTRARKTRKRRV